ncbi:F-box/kelch-repeat protein At3g23880-like [Silene latifolia]|uniref:F-box/kelch-repeat protein At3g23880-like n=1 Tax=Silene latifolia TaxID=37657 RepID=UPI003D780457
MKTRKKTRISEFKYIQPELHTQILANLPAKTVLRFRCVYKSWCDIIDDPDFVTQHRNLCKINSVNSKLLLSLEGSGRYGSKGCSLTVRHADTLRKTHHILKSTERYYLLGSCNELLLTLDHIDTRYQQNLMLWNPCIRKSLRIPPSPMSFRAVVYLFGFVSCSYDYKVIETSFGQDGGSMSVTMVSQK